MQQVQLAARVNVRVKKALDAVCKTRGWKLARFVEEAIIDKLEELEDAEDIAKLKREPTRPLSAILKELKFHGKL